MLPHAAAQLLITVCNMLWQIIRRSTTHHQAIKFGCCLQRKVRNSHQTDVSTAILKFQTTGARNSSHTTRERTNLTAGASGQASSSSVAAADNSDRSPNKDVWGLLQEVLAVALLVCKLFLQLVVDGLRACCLMLHVDQNSLQQQLTNQQTISMGQTPRQGETAGNSLQQQQQQQRIQSKQANSSILMLADEQANSSRLQQKLTKEQANSSRIMQMLEDQQAALRSMEQRLAAEQAAHSRLQQKLAEEQANSSRLQWMLAGGWAALGSMEQRLAAEQAAHSRPQHRSAARNIPTNPWNAFQSANGGKGLSKATMRQMYEEHQHLYGL